MAFIKVDYGAAMRRRRAEDIIELALRACRIALDSARNFRQLVEEFSSPAFIEVRHCESELDRIETQIDRDIARAITGVGENTARELLACLRISMDAERIGDLVWWSAQRVRTNIGPRRLAQHDRRDLAAITAVLERMLEETIESFTSNDGTLAHAAMRRDPEIDRLRHKIFDRHLHHGVETALTQVVLVAQALERAGDHVKNLAEAVLHRAGGESMLHTAPTRRLAGGGS